MSTRSILRTVIDDSKHFVSVVGAFRNWPTYVVHYCGLSRQRYMEIDLRRYKLRIRSVGQKWEFHSLYRLTFVEDEYRLRQYALPTGSVVIDIGAHIGWFTLAASVRIPEVAVFSYEPNPENYLLLAENLRLNSLSRCHAFRTAVGAAAGEGTLTWTSAFGALSTEGTLVPDNVDERSPAPRHMVSITTLDDIMNGNEITSCALLKMDCEGAEHEILAAASPDTLARIERISVEVHQVRDAGMSTLVRLLTERGYRVETGGRWGNILYAVRA